jgi:hypothetical protein
MSGQVILKMSAKCLDFYISRAESETSVSAFSNILQEKEITV